ncbi:hypothetical protein TNCV_4125601 [Trichonephila clavipes]|nr:hypothetical protein TNCV_4125601 [Trichonephila clavipes]
MHVPVPVHCQGVGDLCFKPSVILKGCIFQEISLDTSYTAVTDSPVCPARTLYQSAELSVFYPISSNELALSLDYNDITREFGSYIQKCVEGHPPTMSDSA